MKDEKEYVEKLIAELKRFFTLELEEREKAAFDLNDNWRADCKGLAEISEETEDIVSSLQVLHHYMDDPTEHDYMIQQILLDLEERLNILEREDKEAKGIKVKLVSDIEDDNGNEDNDDDSGEEDIEKFIG